MVIPKAKPTAWNGITFRSKSEAIFAVALNKIPNGIWVYEPTLEGFDFLPDFLLMFSVDKGFAAELVEYKPSKPTDEYVEHLFECFEAYKRGSNKTAPFCVQCSVVYGSPFKDECLHQIKYNGEDEDFAEFLQPAFNEARHYRFDLEAQ